MTVDTIRGPFGAEKGITTKNVGTVATGSSVVEYGDGVNHQTVLTVATTLGAIAGGAALCLGKLVYTFPAGALNVKSTYISMALTQTEGNITADTPEVGVGAVLGAGAHATIGAAGATMENIYDGSTAAADCNGTATVGQQALSLIVAVAGAHTVYFNVADTWAASGDAACAIAGTIIIDWTFVV